MNDVFQRALDFTLRWEGGYANHPNDPGGETYRGISRRAHPLWVGWSIIDEVKPQSGEVIQDAKLETQIALFYFQHYWRAANCDVIEQLAPTLASSVFDMAVHSGPARAVRQLQGLIGETADGIFGPKSQLSLIDHMDRYVAGGYTSQRQNFLGRLVDQDPKLAAFEQGWDNRMEALENFIARG